MKLGDFFKNWDIQFAEGIGVITNCERSFLWYLPSIIQANQGYRVVINAVAKLEDIKGASDNIEAVIEVGKTLNMELLERAGLLRVERVWEKGEYSVLGDTVILWPFLSENPFRVSLMGEQIEQIAQIDSQTRQKAFEIKELEISNTKGIIEKIGDSRDPDVKLFYVLGSIPAGDLGVTVYDLGVKHIPSLDYSDHTTIWTKTLDIYRRQGFRTVYLGDKDDECIALFRDQFDYFIESDREDSHHGFIVQRPKIIVVTSADILGQVDLSDDHRKAVTGEDIFKRFIVNDYIVHEDHGIGIFNGIRLEKEKEYIELLYAGKDRLLVPLDQYSKISKFVGAGKKIPVLTGLNSGVWKRIKKGVEHDVMEIAKDLVQLSAVRSLTKLDPVVDDYRQEKEYWDFAGSFEYEDTEDQSVITSQILEDFKKETPMDRLIVGDVGFGKTELAFRAIFAIANTGKQVALLAPTTILSHQHFNNLLKRFKDYPFKIGELSRLVDEKVKKEAVSDLENGKIDIVVGTHSLLHESVKFKNLGLIVVDEEQRFGVAQKEALKKKRTDTHILSMTATPIPRTLSLALNGVREMSILASVPQDRKPIKNWFGELDWNRIASAILNERERGGQVYYLHNRIADLNRIKEMLEDLIPGLRVAMVYGQMYRNTLNRLMGEFIENKFDVMLSTSIIENGLDLSNVNTLIVDDSIRYGLSQLYQIRGRIGRSTRQAYAYFMYEGLRGNSELRLDALKESEDLGSGFLLSNRDLEIRGAGNILGKEQSGVINSVGYGLYSKMLLDAVNSLRGQALS